MSHALGLGRDRPGGLGCRLPDQGDAMRWECQGRGRGTIGVFPSCVCLRQREPTHTVVRKELMARSRDPGSRNDVPELRPPDQGKSLAGQSLMTQLAGAPQGSSTGGVRGCAPIPKLQLNLVAYSDSAECSGFGRAAANIMSRIDDAVRVDKKVESQQRSIHVARQRPVFTMLSRSGNSN
jgi:hypothetical protein